MSHFDDSHRLIFSPSLNNMIENYEKHDIPLFEPISFRHISTPTHFYANSPRKKSESSKSKSILHISGNNTPLPSLPVDNDTKVLRKKITDLEHRLIDCDSEINDLKKEIRELQDLLQQSERFARESQPKMAHTPNSNKRSKTPPDLSGKELAEYYKKEYESIKTIMDNLKEVLSKNTPNGRRTTNIPKARK